MGPEGDGDQRNGRLRRRLDAVDVSLQESRHPGRKRTWGGLVHTADTPTFIDGGSAIAPRGGFFRRDNHWDVENVGQAPDIDVEDWPKDVAAGHDMQLERAVTEAMTELAAKPVVRATHEPPPPTWGKRIKPPQE